ncbi:patatin-like phospholipase family protein [Pyxidicoccus fallax]|uniref:Patatin-like phospholipase family protein n=1 Tax=Pyxidicoccus fallax TaxID=394095 RepID=A0A848LBQ1_9BACT|nr:patatin-like phospholipase family protein [Pyxidicoccus fallax]NMO15662.1 patatin-like phospholipase family protein [Pyxidicoccus fallax]NPC78782.1 patatin-like phospholipase family protein [Pyxidicoccus fallax]
MSGRRAPRTGPGRGAALAALLLIAGMARAEAPEEPALGPGPGAAAYSLTVSGGVALGAYEAGFLEYAVATSRAVGMERLRLLTGASAGSLNGLLAVLAACGDEAPGPTQSLFWDTWIPVGYGRLFVPEDVTPLGVFSRAWLEAQARRLEAAWNRGLSPTCDVVLGVSVTRVEPRLVHVAGGRLPLPRMEEKFALRIQGRGPGQPPRVTNYTAPGSTRREPLLVTDARGEVAFAQVRDLVLASMAFPVAFPPKPLATCAAGATAHPGVCLPTEAHEADYIDGGIFDNTPLRLAVGLARDGLTPAPKGGPMRWRDVPEPGRRSSPTDVFFVFVDPDATEYPAAPGPVGPRAAAQLPRMLGGVVSAFIDTARSKELALLVEEEPEIAQRLSLPRRHFPAASAPLAAFLGFFETAFRSFDFYLGMYDARVMMQEAAAAGLGRFEPPEGAGADWTPLRCMRAVYDGLPGAEAACAGEALADFRALLQVSLDRLYSVCRDAKATPGPRGWRNAHCERATTGQTPPRVPGLAPKRWPDWRQGAQETELAHTLRLLGAYGFHFRDLGAPPGRDDIALMRIRQSFGSALRRLADAQPDDGGGAVEFAGKLLADSVAAYAPPRTSLHLVMGPTLTELGVSLGTDSPEMPRGLRLSGALGLRGLQRVFSSAEGESFALAAVAGPEFRPPALQAGLVQGRLALRAGWQFSTRNRSAGEDCHSAGVSACSRPVVQGLLGATFLERLRVQVVGEWYPPSGGHRGLWTIAPGLGVELHP